MRGILKALILGWIGKKIYDRVTDDDEPEKDAAPAKNAAHAKRAAPKRTSRKPARRAA
jgi:hypothetical protein